MEREERILRFIDCRATGDECRELLKELQEDGTLGEVLLSDAATLFMYSREELLEYFSPEEVDEIEQMRDGALNKNLSLEYTNDEGEEYLRAVAEKGEKYNTENK